MIHSMTAFSRQTLNNDKGLMVLELKSVNHRFSEIALRLPDDLRLIEPKIRERIGQALKRGKVDCTLRYRTPELVESNIDIDQDLLHKLLTISNTLEAKVAHSAPINVIELMKWPGVLKAPEQDMSELGEQALAMLDDALLELQETRAREGRQIELVIKDKCQKMTAQVGKVADKLPEIIENMRTRLVERLAEFKAELDEVRLEQEMVFLINKSDVAEELERLGTHITEVERVLDKGGPVGRRMDFLMQELNREANTLGSKSIDTEMTKASVELKVLIEQIREQVQNLE